MLVMEVSGSVGGGDEGIVDAERAEVEAELLLALVVEALGIIGRLLGTVSGLERHLGHRHGRLRHHAVEQHRLLGLLHLDGEVHASEAILDTRTAIREHTPHTARPTWWRKAQYRFRLLLLLVSLFLVSLLALGLLGFLGVFALLTFLVLSALLVAIVIGFLDVGIDLDSDAVDRGEEGQG